MALYFYFNETTGDLVYSDKATYDAEGYTSLGEQTDTRPLTVKNWVFHSKRSGIKTVSKDPAIGGRISQMTTMPQMFSRCSSLTSIDLSGFDTSNTTNMQDMFNGCSSLTSIDLSGFDTSKVRYIGGMFVGCSIDTVRCRPKQFLKPDFIIPSSSGSWYDFKGTEVTDFSSNAAISLYSDPSKAPDGSKLVNLQDLKAALEAMDDGVFPFSKDTIIAESDGKPVWFYVTDASGGSDVPGFVGYIAQGESLRTAALMCGLLQIEGNLPVGDSGYKRMSIGMGLASDGPAMKFMYDNAMGVLTYKDGMPVLTAMGETGPIMAGENPYGFATYATDEDFESYVFQQG